jgi:hypothetical protein
VPLGQRRVVRRVVWHGEPVVPGVELDRVRHSGRGQRVVKQLGVPGREPLVLDRAGHVDRRADVAGRQVRAVRVVGDGDPRGVERRGGGDLVADAARRHQRHAAAHAVTGGPDGGTAHLWPRQQEIGVGVRVGDDPAVGEAPHEAEEPLAFLPVGERGVGVERRPVARPVEDVGNERDVPEAGEVVAHVPHGVPQSEGVGEDHHARPWPRAVRDVERSVAHAITSGDLYIDARHLGLLNLVSLCKE